MPLEQPVMSTVSGLFMDGGDEMAAKNRNFFDFTSVAPTFVADA